MGKRILVTGLGTFWGGRLAQMLERDPEVDVIVGLDRFEPTVALERTEFVRSDASYSAIIGAWVPGRLPNSRMLWIRLIPRSESTQRCFCLTCFHAAMLITAMSASHWLERRPMLIPLFVDTL